MYVLDFNLTSEMNPGNAARVVDILRGPRLLIPTEEDYGSREHDEWLKKTEAELVEGTRRALVASFGRVAAGTIVFRPEPDNPNVIAIRNISINPHSRDLGVAEFALKCVENMALEMNPETTKAIVDTKTTNHGMIGFLESQGYAPEEIVDLYGSGKPDVILSKRLKSRGATVFPRPFDDPSIR